MPMKHRMRDTKPWPFKQQALRLPDLDDDALSLIVAVLAHESARTLQALALVSQRFWHLCGPLMFREIAWAGAGAIPPAVAAQARLLRVAVQSGHAEWDALSGALRCMTLLREVALDVSTDVPAGVWDAIAALGNVRTVRVRGFPTFAMPEKGPRELARLLIGVGDVKVAGADRLASSVAPPSPSSALRGNSARALLDAHAASLEEIKLPAQLLSSGLPASPLPALRKLTLTGTLPPGLSIPALLLLTPHLRELSILLTLPPHDEYGPVLIPAASASQDTPASSSRSSDPSSRSGSLSSRAASPSLSTLVPYLRSLALSNLNPEDRILDDPPQGLEALNLVPVSGTGDATVGLSEEHAFAVVGALAAARSDLRDLRLFTREQAPAELAEAVAYAFPRLHTLQLGIDMYKPERPAYTPVWADFAAALAPLRSLRALYLGLDLPVGVHVEDYASFFCRRLPALDVVGMQALLGAAGLRAHSPFAVPAPAEGGWVWAPRVEWSCAYMTRLGDGEFAHRCGTYVPLAGVF